MGRSRRGLKVAGVDGVIITQDRGKRYMIHGGGGGNTALKYLISSEGKGERIGGSVVNKMGSDVSKEAKKKQGL